jgi:predicted small secreted protein
VPRQIAFVVVPMFGFLMNWITFTMLKRMLFIVVSVLILTTLSGCNTVHGFGQDVQHLGGAISRAG